MSVLRRLPTMGRLGRKFLHKLPDMEILRNLELPFILWIQIDIYFLASTIYVTSAKGERRKAAQWVGQGGRSRTLRGAQVTDEHHLEVGRVVCVHDRKMKEPWCLVASESTVGTRTLIRYYGKRWGIETSFRDIKDMRFGMGLSARRVSSPQRRDRMLLLSALAIALLSLLGGAVGGCEKPRINGEHKIWGLTSGDDVFSQIGRLVAGSSLPAMNTRCVRTLGRVTRRAGAQRRSREEA